MVVSDPTSGVTGEEMWEIHVALLVTCPLPEMPPNLLIYCSH